MRAVISSGFSSSKNVSLGSWLLLLCACSMPRPDGAFSPTEETFDDSRSDFSTDAGAELADGGPVDGLPSNLSGLVKGRDQDPKELSAAQRELFALTGRYLMRADIYSVVAAQQLFAKLEVKNQTTHFSVAEVAFDPKQNRLLMTERLCYQRYAHECVTGCKEWTTDVDGRATAFFPYVKRKLTLSGTRFVGEEVPAALGYDGKADELPQKANDPRVWDLDGKESVREGLLTRIHASGTPVGDVSCDVYQVQDFHSSFSGELSEDGLSGATGTLDTKGSTGKRLGAAGPNAQTCKSDSGGVTPSQDPNTIGLIRIPLKKFEDAEFWSCPSLETFEEALKAAKPE